ncbi:MAG TPA: hypothetical protein DCZ94_08240 [Lentisphaeria bacterium]|nr:MAG: hypothetical protein A2X48_19720 [Lentisphaerae bacterium GWF2_49_21]HBC86926.1 hypothetical protein [Lentisphaeria bacterium]
MKIGGKKQNAMPTQAVVASAAGVSQQTVSQALSGTGRISESVRRHVIEVANKLEYRPNKMALALRRNDHGTIGLIGLGDSNRSFVPNVLLQNLQASLLKIHKHLALVPVLPSEIDALKDNPGKLGIDGAFVNITRGDIRPLLNIFQSAGIPEIWINNKQKYNCVYPDDYGASFQITSFLTSRQYLGIGFVGYSRRPDRQVGENHYSVKDRYLGYRDAMAGAGIKATHFIIDEMTTDSLRSFLKMAQPSPVLLCYELNHALRVLLIAKTAGVKIPEELKIIYFHESPYWDKELDAMIRCLPIPNDKLAEAAIAMYENKNRTQAKNVRSVPVPYDSSYFKHVLTTRDYVDIVEGK